MKLPQTGLLHVAVTPSRLLTKVRQPLLFRICRNTCRASLPKARACFGATPLYPVFGGNREHTRSLPPDSSEPRSLTVTLLGPKERLRSSNQL